MNNCGQSLVDSVHAASLAASRVEQALSEAASSLSSFSPRPGPQGAWMIQLKIWLLLADVYLAIDQPHDAMFCIQEASQIYPLSHHIMYMVSSSSFFKLFRIYFHGESDLIIIFVCFIFPARSNPCAIIAMDRCKTVFLECSVCESEPQ